MHAGQFDFGRVETVFFAAQLGAEAFVEGERGGFGHAVGDHASVEGMLVRLSFDALVVLPWLNKPAGHGSMDKVILGKGLNVLRDCQYMNGHWTGRDIKYLPVRIRTRP